MFNLIMLVTVLKKIIKKLYWLQPIPNKELKNISALLKDNKINIADVGSAEGVGSNFQDISSLCKFITFDPDQRAEQKILEKALIINHSIGLWSKKMTKRLFLKKNAQSSSFYKTNDRVLSQFLNYHSHDTVDVQRMKVDSLQNVLKKDFEPDFIKIDTEGSDLEILKGAKSFLSHCCLGVQVEVSFIERHENAPYFSEIDQYLRAFDFTLMDLKTEKWIRKNNCSNLITNHQIVWADAIYMLSIDSFLKRISNLAQCRQEEKITKFITLALSYRMHDFANEILRQVTNNLNISEELIKKLDALINKSVGSFSVIILKITIGIAIALFANLLLLFIPKYRKFARRFLKNRIRETHKIILKITKCGPSNCCIANGQ